MNVLFVIDSLNGGGAARVTTILANELVKNNYEISIATNLAYRGVVYDLDPSIKLFSFYTKKDQNKGTISKILRHAYYLRKVIKAVKPDLIIGEQEGGILYSYLAKMFLGIPMIGHRHNTFKILGLSKAYRLIYKMPQKTVLLHNEDVRYVDGKIQNAVAIYNPHTFPVINKLCERKNQVICVGSINRWYNKGLDVMIRMWGDIADKHKEWKLVIVGGGSDASFQILKSMTAECNCTDSVVFTGTVNNVDNLLQESAIFALPSRVEGFPMVLNEAISQGCPSIAFSLDGVLAEIYSDKSVCQIPDGDTEMFKKELENLMGDEKLRCNYSNEALKETTKYLPEVIVKEWITIINEVVKY